MGLVWRLEGVGDPDPCVDVIEDGHGALTVATVRRS
jgi:hypothetical protein